MQNAAVLTLHFYSLFCMTQGSVWTHAFLIMQLGLF